MNDSEARVIILAGGQGTRIRSLYPDLPKPLIPVNGRPFIEWIIFYLKLQGFLDFTISLGHLAGIAESYFRQRPQDGLSIKTVREEAPLGTAGAVRFVYQQCSGGESLVVVNGDSLAMVDFERAWSLFDRAEVDGVIFGLPTSDAARFGTLALNADNSLKSFREKSSGTGIVNAGIYLFKKRILELFPEHVPLSLEENVFPALLMAGARFEVCVCDVQLLDIGTPESLSQAENFIKKYMPEAEQ